MNVPALHAHVSQAGSAAESRWRLAGLLVLALLFSAALLRTLDQVPSWLLDEPRAPRTFDTLDELESDLRTRLLLPAYFPERFEWPASRVVLLPGEGRPVLIVFQDRDTRRDGLLICQTTRDEAPIPSRVTGRAAVRVADAADVNGKPAVWREGREEGRRFTELEWTEPHRRLLVRTYDEGTDLLRVARSVSRGRS